MWLSITFLLSSYYNFKHGNWASNWESPENSVNIHVCLVFRYPEMKKEHMLTISPECFWLTTGNLNRHHCIHVPQLIYQHHDAYISKQSFFNNQQTSGIENSPVVPPASSHLQPSSAPIDAIDQYMSLESRVWSFTQAWPLTAEIHTPRRMAMAGFVYMGGWMKYTTKQIVTSFVMLGLAHNWR